MGYILLVMIVLTYVILQKIKFENMEVELYRSEDQCCYDMNLGRRRFTFDNGIIRSTRIKHKRKVIKAFEDVESCERMDWKTKWKIYRNY